MIYILYQYEDMHSIMIFPIKIAEKAKSRAEKQILTNLSSSRDYDEKILQKGVDADCPSRRQTQIIAKATQRHIFIEVIRSFTITNDRKLNPCLERTWENSFYNFYALNDPKREMTFTIKSIRQYKRRGKHESMAAFYDQKTKKGFLSSKFNMMIVNISS